MKNILVHYTLVDNNVDDQHVRLVVHENTKLQGKKPRVFHYYDDSIDVHEFISNNWSFYPIYEKKPFKLELDNSEFVNQKKTTQVQFPPPVGDHSLEVIYLGLYGEYRIFGFRTIGMGSQLNSPDIRETVIYTLETCKGLEDEGILEFIHNSFLGLGYNSFF